MKTAAAGIGTATLGGVGLIAATGGGAAADATINIDADDVSISSDDGSIQYIDIGYWKQLEWSGFNTEVAAFSIENELTIAIDGGDPVVEDHTLYDADTVSLPAPGDDNNEDYGTGVWGSASYTTGPGTSGTLTAGIGDAVKLPDTGSTDGISEQGADTRWTIVEGSEYNTDADDASGYGIPATPVVDHDGGIRDDEYADGYGTPTTGEAGTLDAPVGDSDVDTTHTLHFTYTITFTLHDAAGNDLTGANSDGPDDPTLTANFNIDVTNEATEAEGDGNGDAGGA